MLVRSVCSSIEAWDLEPLEWIFKASPDEKKRIEGRMEKLLAHRDRCASLSPLLKCLQGSSNVMRDPMHWGGELAQDLLSDAEDRLLYTGSIVYMNYEVRCGVVMDLLCIISIYIYNIYNYLISLSGNN